MEILPRLAAALSDRYRIIRLVGEGGMALVYLADDLKHGRQVAIKVLRPEVSTALGTERFLREIEVAARLNHPNVLALHDSGEADGLLYFVMPYVEGESLRERLTREGRLPVDEAMRIAAEIADALDYAHGQGLVHRDMKPENILFQAGHALVCDFGIAQVATGAEERLTRTGVSVGTLAYMSPEQLDEHAVVDGRADVYALGCILHEMLSGSNPFGGSTPQVALARKLTGEVPDLTATRPEVPPTVQPVVKRALSVDPGGRFPTAGVFVASLKKATTRVAVEAEERRLRRRGRVRAALTTVGILALGAVGWGIRELAVAPAMERVAVMPFRNGDRDPGQDFFVAGLYEDLNREFSRLVRVVSASSVLPLAESGRSPGEIAAEFGVDGWVTGVATVGADRVVLELELVDRETGDIVWTQAFENHPRRLLALYHAAARTLAERMGVRLTEEQLERLASAQELDPEVKSALFQARYEWQSLTQDGLDTAEEYYRLALERSDSMSAEAWFGLGQVWGLRAQMGYIAGNEALARSGPYFERARELDPELQAIQAQAALMGWASWDWEAASQAFVNALQADPTDARTRAYFSHTLLITGQPDEARVQAEQAFADDPYNELVMSVYAQFMNFAGEFQEAERVFQRILDRSPGSPLALSNFRTTYHLQGRFDEAIDVWRAFYRGQQGDSVAARVFDEGYQADGYRGALVAVAREYAAREDPSKYWQVATLYTRAGEREGALEYLEKSLEVRDPNLPYISVDRIFDDLRDEPRFQALFEPLNLSDRESGGA